MFSHTAVMLAALLASPGVDDINPDAHDYARVVEAHRSAQDVEIHVLDSEGELAAVLVVTIAETETGAQIRLEADFGDGLYMSSSATPGGEPLIESNNATVVEQRLAAILDLQPDSGGTESSPAGCAWAAVGAAAGCIAVQFIFCTIGSIVAACECLPELVDEFEDIECPGFG
jgi:hypothetical protein